MAFAPDCRQSPCPAYFVNDGGIFYSSDPVTSTYTDLNSPALAISEFTGGDLGASFDTTKIALGGTQDNGTDLYAGNEMWNEVSGGDGGFAQIDQRNTQFMYTE